MDRPDPTLTLRLRAELESAELALRAARAEAIVCGSFGEALPAALTGALQLTVLAAAELATRSAELDRRTRAGARNARTPAA